MLKILALTIVLWMVTGVLACVAIVAGLKLSLWDYGLGAVVMGFLFVLLGAFVDEDAR